MNCKKVKVKLLEYLVNDLSDEFSQAITTHIKSCPDCQKELEELKKTFHVFDQLPNTELLPEQQQQFLSEVRQKIRRQIQVKPARYRWKWLLPRLIPAAVAASILIFFVMMRMETSDKNSLKQASKIFTSPSLSFSGEFVNDYFKTNSNETALNEELSQFNSNVIEGVESYLSNQLDVNDLVEDMTNEEKTLLVKQIEAIL